MARELEIVKRYMSNPPVQVEQIIHALGISFGREMLPEGQSGYIKAGNGKYRIVVNGSEGARRQRFTAAHELAHYLLHREKLGKNGHLARHDDSLYGDFADANPAQPFNPRHEVEANKLAAEIIMPSSIVRAEYNQSVDNVEELMAKFEVSRPAMEIRLKNLGLR